MQLMFECTFLVLTFDLMNAQYLLVADHEKDHVLTLGADQDALGRLFVPIGNSLAPFSPWLPAAASAAITAAEPQSVSLSALLARCTQAIKTEFLTSAWVRIEISQLKYSGGHLYLGAIERGGVDGTEELAKTTAMIWSSNVTKLVNKFSAATSMELAKGIQVLVLAKPEFHAKFGLSLQILDIDPTYTLGDLEARLKKIRADLEASGDAQKNRKLPTPDDYFSVCIISPAGAAGLEDFRAEADILSAAGLCKFTYLEAVFQGDKTKESIRKAIVEAHYANESNPFCALVIIRGGGAAADLHWLDERLLATMVCRFHCPVFTGIGHERDKSILDEYANRAFGTPSKVIGHIRESITKKALKGAEHWDAIAQSSAAKLDGAESRITQRMIEIETGAEKALSASSFESEKKLNEITNASIAMLHSAEAKTAALSTSISTAALNTIEIAAKNVNHHFVTVTDLTAVSLNAHESKIENDLASVTLAARRSIDGVEMHLDDQLKSILGSVGTIVTTLDVDTKRQFDDIKYFARETIVDAENSSRELMSGILAHGVEPTLRRGFAMVRNSAGPVSSKAAAQGSAELEIVFRDGTVNVTKGNQHG